MKRALIVATVASAIKLFAMENIKILQELGYEVHVATNFITGSACDEEQINNFKQTLIDLNIKYFQIDFTRNALDLKKHIVAYRSLKSVMNQGEYDLVNCHTPIASAVCRLAARNYRKSGTKVIYIAHGFHFYKGAPLKNWLIYYPIEKICSYMTDVIVTTNFEDFAFAQKKLNVKKTEYVPGVGIDTDKFDSINLTDVERAEFREKLGVPKNAKLLVSVGELNENKNHQVILKAISLLEDKNIHYAIAGIGDKADYLTELAKKLGLANRFHLLGFRNDIVQIYKAADICCFPSIREGLGMAALEGMAAGLPLVASVNRGTKDYCKNDVNGYMCDPFSPEQFAIAIEKILNDKDLYIKMRKNNMDEVKNFSILTVKSLLFKIYSDDR